MLLKLVNDILDLSKIEAGTLEFVYSDVDINLLLNDLEQLFRMKIGSNSPVRIITEPGLPSCMVHTDRNRIAQVVSNFVSNAIKFTTEGSIRIGYQSSENGLRFYVSDTGSGISADKLEGVFDRFVRLQSDKNGNGLGLSICKTIGLHCPNIPILNPKSSLRKSRKNCLLQYGFRLSMREVIKN